MKRLKRPEGHLRALISMFDSGKDCVALAQQLNAVESALTNAKRELIRDHIDHCLENAVAQGDKTPSAALNEIRALSKYL